MFVNAEDAQPFRAGLLTGEEPELNERSIVELDNLSRRPGRPRLLPPKCFWHTARRNSSVACSYRDLEEMTAERSVQVDHSRIARWVLHFQTCLIWRQHASLDL